MRTTRLASCIGLLVTLLGVMPAWGVDILTQHVDIARTGADTQEPSLVPSSISSSTFGKLYTVSLNADVNGQPLYVAALSINGGTHNTLFCSTSNNTNGSPCGIYAFDADTGASLWSHTLTNAAQYATSTPTIDLGNQIMFFTTKDNDNNGLNRLHAVSLGSGNELTGSPVTISASVSGNGDGGSNGVVSFTTSHANSRPGVLLVNGVIYLGFSFNSDARPYHGWVMGYTYTNGKGFAQVSKFCVTPDADSPNSSGASQCGGGIWAAGGGLVSDGTSVFCTTGNGNFTVQNGGRNYGMCMLKLNPSTLSVEDWFAEANAIKDSNSDGDLGNAGPMLIPGTSVLFAGPTKYNRGHLVNAKNMGHFNSTKDSCLQTISMSGGSSVGPTPVSWNGGTAGTFMYVWLRNHGLSQYAFQSSSSTFSNNGSPIKSASDSSGGNCCISSNGTADGVVWSVGYDATVHANLATDVSQELWNSNQNSSRDGLPSFGHFQYPMVANGRLYVPTGNQKIVVYGFLHSQTASKLVIESQPGNASAATTLPAPRVAFQTSQGSVVTGDTAAVSVALGDNPGHATLSGTTTVTPVDGIATFTNLSISAAGSPYTLVFSSAGLPAVTSNTFTISAQVDTPVITPSGRTFSGPVTFQISDGTSGAAIFYTTNGSTPTTSSATYSSANPPRITATSTVRAIATHSGLGTSAVAAATITITGSTPYGMPYRPVVTGVSVPPVNSNPPTTLSATHLFANLSTFTPVAGIVPYSVNTPLWSDAALKQRWIILPGTATIPFTSSGTYSFPGGTMFIKNFELGVDDTNPSVIKRLETRVLVLNSSGTDGYGITYKWRSDNSDADLLTAAGEDETITIKTATGTRTQVWHYPSQNECLTCHTTNAGFVLGVKTGQLNGPETYPSTGITDNQIRTWNYLGMFTTPIAESSIAGLEALKAITNTSASLQDRFKSYVDANCSQCHRPGGVAANWDARYDTPIGSQDIIYGPLKNSESIPGACVVVPQSLTESMLYLRLNTNGTTKMPPLARNVIDSTAVSVIGQWIGSLTPSAPVISSAGSASGTVGTAFNFDVTASFNPTSFTATGLPDGLQINAQTGLISGTPTSAGTYTATISATNSGGTGKASLSFTIISTGGGGTGQPGPLISGAIYFLTPRCSGLHLDVLHSGTSAGTNVQQFTPNGTNAQRWLATAIGNGYFTFTAQCSGLNLDEYAGSKTPGTNVQEYTPNGSGAQGWNVISVGSGYFKLVNQASGLCLDVAGNSTASSSNVQASTDDGSTGEQWEFTLSNSAAPDIQSGGIYTLTAQCSGLHLDVLSSSTVEGAHVQQWPANGTAAQQWKVTDTGGGSYELAAQCSSMLLDVPNGSTASGVLLQQWPDHNGANQRWVLEPLGSGYYLVISLNSGLCLDVPGSSTASGVRVQQYPSDNSSSQKWHFDLVAPPAVGQHGVPAPGSAALPPVRAVPPLAATPASTPGVSALPPARFGGEVAINEQNLRPLADSAP